jgi:hypothetical protein
MLNATLGVLNNETNKPIWNDHEAFSEGVMALTESIAAIGEQTQLAQGNPGASGAKEQARLALCKAGCEIIGAVRAFAAVNADPELAAKVAYTESELTAGKANEVVTRCKGVHAAAAENLDKLGKYGVTNAKLATLKKAIDAFDALKTAPRQGRVTRSASTQLLPQLVRSAVAIARDQLDGLMPQFKEAHPNFYQEYFSAR